MNIGTITVANTATIILASNTARNKITITNPNDVSVFIGSDNSVTTANGYPIEAYNKIEISDYSGDIYGIVAASTEDVTYFEEV